MLQYLWNLLHLFDQVCNTVLGGDPRMTLSARMGRDIVEGKCKTCGYICKFLNVFQSDHCAMAWASEKVAPLIADQIAKE